MNYYSQKESRVMKIIGNNLRRKVSTGARTAAVAVAAALCSCHTAMAQKEKGNIYLLPRVGMNLSCFDGNEQLVGLDNSDYRTVKSKPKVGFVAGCEAEYMLRNNVGLRGGMLYSVMGDRLETGADAVGDLKTSLDYISVPVMVTLYLTDWLSMSGGVQYSRMIHSDISDERGGEYSDWWLRKNDFALPVSFAAEYRGFVFEGRVIYSMNNISRLDDMSDNVKNIAYQFTLGYRIKLSK